MSPRPVVHIGYHKTATSWFQARVYPAVPGWRMVDRTAVRATLLDACPFLFDGAAARARLGVEDGPPAIICEEDLSGVLHNGHVSQLVGKEAAARIHAALPDARIVIFVRAQESAVASWYMQYLREGGTRSIRRYLFPDAYRHLGHVRPFKLPHFRFRQLDYTGLVQSYDALFGRENVFVYPYEALRRDPAALLARMRADLGLPLPEVAGAGGNNTGYRRGLIPLLRFANLFTVRSVIDKAVLFHLPYWYIARKWLFAKLNRWALFGPPAGARNLLDDETRTFVRQRFWRSNQWLEARLGVPLAPLGYAVEPAAEAVRPGPGRLFGWARN